MGGFQWHDASCSKVFFNEVFTGLCFHWIKGIDLGDFGNEVRMKLDDMVIRVMGRELVVDFL